MSCKSKITTSSLNKRIVIEDKTLTTDGQGGHTEVWATFATVWAKIEPKKSWEKWQSDRPTQITTHRITARKLTGLNSRMRITYEGRLFYLKGSIDEDEAGRFNIINAQEGVQE